MGGFYSNGKQVLHGSAHVADACDPSTAEQIADALNAYRDPEPCPVMPELRNVAHAIRQENDEYACICGARWDVSEGPEHP